MANKHHTWAEMQEIFKGTLAAVENQEFEAVNELEEILKTYFNQGQGNKEQAREASDFLANLSVKIEEKMQQLQQQSMQNQEGSQNYKKYLNALETLK